MTFKYVVYIAHNLLVLFIDQFHSGNLLLCGCVLSTMNWLLTILPSITYRPRWTGQRCKDWKLQQFWLPVKGLNSFNCRSERNFQNVSSFEKWWVFSNRLPQFSDVTLVDLLYSCDEHNSCSFSAWSLCLVSLVTSTYRELLLPILWRRTSTSRCILFHCLNFSDVQLTPPKLIPSRPRNLR